MIIYKITNLINGKIYIGQDSKNSSTYFGSGKLICRAIKKYGKENFIKEILEDNIDLYDLLNSREKYWIAFFNTTNVKIGYNIHPGGEGHKHELSSEETKQKISDATRGENNPMYGVKRYGKDNPFYDKHHTEEIKEKIRTMNTGKKGSIEKREKCSNNTKGIKNPMYGRCAYDIWVEKYGKEEADRRKKLTSEKKSKSAKGILKGKMRDETKKKLSNARIGTKLSEETKEKMRKSWYLRKLKTYEQQTT